MSDNKNPFDFAPVSEWGEKNKEAIAEIDARLEKFYTEHANRIAANAVLHSPFF